ncbi:MAG: GGDEF domain-containing protein [Solirubrobacteraceae bacterium]
MRFPVVAKLASTLIVLLVALLAVGFAGLRGLSDLRGKTSSLYHNNTLELQRTAALVSDTDAAANLALRIIASNHQSTINGLQMQLSGSVVPQVNADFAVLRQVIAGDVPAEKRGINRAATLWGGFVALLRTGPVDRVVAGSAAAHDNALSVKVARIFTPIDRLARQRIALETAQAAAAATAAQRVYDQSRTLMVVTALVALLVGVVLVALLTRTVVLRVRRYADFAARVAAGDAEGGVVVTGHDELADLGRTLNAMVNRQVILRAQEESQAEFADTMQLTESEAEAHGLLKRQLERSIPGSAIVVLNRNNSADRLQATTPIARDALIADRLASATPRSCLAVRFARTHREGMTSDPLLSCEVCGKSGEQVTCEPLLVSGEVIGSVLTTHSVALSEAQTRSIKDSVAQAAPVLANLRNLAIAETRAATDALTGLPNNRAIQDTLKRLVAHAARTDTPLAAILLDLDHFKQINDTYGHGRGDDVLAALGAVLEANMRASDFAGRYGGEEFIVLLPDTERGGALTFAEKLREAISTITVPGVDRRITASLGVAILPLDAADAATLIRQADRALYTAKSNGRNRVESILGAEPSGLPLDPDASGLAPVSG